MSEKFNIDHMALLARLNLSDSEKDRLGKQMETIIEYIDHLEQLDTQTVEPTSHAIPLQNVFREDEKKQIFPECNTLDLAPAQKKRHYEVPQII
ncbi:MAG: aspartyl/glutamyl-tRNA(Asn/Gln) amidotransferase subunit C [Nitrospinaceae bacterium]|nr:MAG: aspartyl/glutamyl-tRNA(Asn/Gln) amidotransferase subunit C [Nitrospinaceae bacterium]